MQVVGRAQAADGNYYAALWDNGTIVNLGGLGAANAINAHGEIVGTTLDAQGQSTATLWRNGTQTDLNTFLSAQEKADGWSLVAASGINDNGWIIGLASNPEGGTTPFLLAAAVTEPHAYLMLLAGLGVVALLHRRLGARRGDLFSA